ncbi:MAG: NTP transferase domain-containing protein [Treponema sp.]|jgi:CTP:phosphocholine cytidylyltransferase-like protein|nr:NTP transferase domain-containing protein [Treponema sp.]
MELTRTQFDVLVFLESRKDEKNLTQRSIAQSTGLSVGTVNKTLVNLNEIGLIKNTSLSSMGTKALEPFQVKRAVFIAAGFGSRLVPVSLNTPKPLVRVKGKRIIDTLLDAICATGIDDIIIVRGYLGEQFDQLMYKYPMVKFLENPLYNESNNISSAMVARYMLQNAYVLESDLILNNPGLITKYQYTSNYLAVPTERSDDWCFETRNGIITRVRVGGRNCHHMFGISYWNQTDGAKLADHIKQVFEMPGGKERYWDQVPLEYFIKDYTVEVRECSFNDVIEIDTFNELKAIDENYRIG